MILRCRDTASRAAPCVARGVCSSRVEQETASSVSYGLFKAIYVAPRAGRHVVLRDTERVGVGAPFVSLIYLTDLIVSLKIGSNKLVEPALLNGFGFDKKCAVCAFFASTPPPSAEGTCPNPFKGKP